MISEFDEKEFTMVQHYLDIGRYQNAEKIMNSLLERNPANPKLLNTMAVIQIEMDELEKADHFCREAITLGELNEESYHILGIIHYKLKDYAAAEEYYLESLRYNPENPQVLAKYGYLMLKTGHEQKAEKLLEEALAIDPDDPVVINISLQFYLVKNKKEQQLQALSKYLQYSDDEIGKMARVGTVELLRGNYKAARENFIGAYLLDPTDEDILSIIQEIDQEYHPVFFPQRMIRKVGGPAVVWIGAVVILIVLPRIGLTSAALIFAPFYLLLCVYTWLTPAIYKFFFKK